MPRGHFVRITVRPDVYRELLLIKEWFDYRENSDVLRDAFKAYRLVYNVCGRDQECVRKVVRHVNSLD